MAAYLELYPPRRAQWRNPRRSTPSGVTVLHTAENMIDLMDADSGAENVAGFIRNRTDPGSYHDLVDSDSAIHLVPYRCEAYQDGTGTNPHALSISWAIRAADWSTMAPERRHGMLLQGAAAFARQQEWLRSHGHPTTPLRRISRDQSTARQPGFVTHGDRDPGRRSDPGAGFPWEDWYAACRVALDQTGAAYLKQKGWSTVSVATQRAVHVKDDGYWGPNTDLAVNVVRMAINSSYPLGVRTAQERVGAKPDGIWGPRSRAALKETIAELQRAWSTIPDGIWGHHTEIAWTRARQAYYVK